jgi:hypothetical protein
MGGFLLESLSDSPLHPTTPRTSKIATSHFMGLLPQKKAHLKLARA